ncbi:MAG: hypothetical protein ACFFDN_47540 [Candidatus Hodarchaeota archaeon]
MEIEINELLEKKLDIYIFEDICYKENSHIPIIEESAKLKIAQVLARKGKKVLIRDYSHMIQAVKMEYGNIFNYEVIENQNKNLEK